MALRIGFYLYHLDGDFQLTLYNGIRKEAAALGMDLVCIQGEMFREFTRPSIHPFKSMKQTGLDGILIASSLIFYNVSGGMLPILKDISSKIPLVSIGMKLFDFPSVLLDNKKPLKLLIEHMVITHGCRKFLYMGGQLEHPHSIEREEAFKKTIRSMKNQFSGLSGKIFNSSFTGIMVINTFRKYIESNPDEPPDCIICGNDIIAINIQKLLREEQNRRWQNCPVTGFDDIFQARFSFPPLTTIRQPLDAMGGIAVRILYSLIQKKPTKKIVLVEPELIIRQSCGCTEKEYGGEDVSLLAKKAIMSPYYLQPVSVLGHALVLIHDLPEMAQHLCDFLTALFIKNFYLILYPNITLAQINETGLVVYSRRDYVDEDNFLHPGIVNIASLINNIMHDERGTPQAWCLYYLQTGNELLGLIIYESQEQVHPQIDSCAIFVANTLKRLRNYESEVLRISEMERLRFSMELHDDICQRLAGISMYCQSRLLGGNNEPFMRKITSQIEETLKRTRRFAHDSFPMELDSMGLKQALFSLCDQVNKETSCRCAYTWNTTDADFLSKAQEINIYRIVQEALHNVMKHSSATEAAVEVRTQEEFLVISIRDNGRGLSVYREEGIGLKSMEYRSHQVGAEYSLKSDKGKGVCIELRILRT
jgi:signal transduction histidine kinase/DNA-binding LacI/PurR family transcriptional regulator